MFCAGVRLASECLAAVTQFGFQSRNVYNTVEVRVWFLFVVKMNYEAERAMSQKRLRMEGEPGHGVVQGNGLPLNYIGE